MSKELAIVLESYEKRSFYRFFFIFVIASLLLFTALASLYYYKERSRIFSEEKTKNYLQFAECKKFQKLLHSQKKCEMQEVLLDGKLDEVYKEISVAFMIMLLLTTLFSFLLAKLTLKPMRNSVEMMDSFINGIVHDINTPLSVININAQSLQKKLTDTKLQAKNKRILQGVKHIESLEEQLLFMLRIHNYSLKPTTFNLQKHLQQRLHYYNDIRSDVTIVLEGKELLIEADKDALTRMIDNIVINAIKYSHPKSEVNITLEGTKLFIKDSGVGIKKPKEVFNKYYRESHSTKGLGLGLYVVKEIAHLHHIKIDINSTFGEGTTFIVDVSAICS